MKDLLDRDLRPSYELIFVSETFFVDFLNVFHRATCVFCFYEDLSKEKERKAHDLQNQLYIPYRRVNDCFEGVLYLKELKCVMFDHVDLDYYTHTPRMSLSSSAQRMMGC